MKDIAVLARDGSFFGATFLAKALDAAFYVGRTSKMKMEQYGVAGLRWPENPIEEEHLLVVGCGMLVKVAEQIEAGAFKSVGFIASTSGDCRRAKWWNAFVAKHKIPVYLMPDLVDFCKVPYTPVYQAIYLPSECNVNIRGKAVPFTICHSPNNKGGVKGSKYVRKIMRRFPLIVYDELNGLDWLECLERKGEASLFIDQIILGNKQVKQQRFGGKTRYNGGLGKSGLEAMLMGCPVIVGAPKPDMKKVMPRPPVGWIDANKLERSIRSLYKDSKLRLGIAQECQEWARRYTDPLFVAQLVVRHIL